MGMPDTWNVKHAGYVISTAGYYTAAGMLLAAGILKLLQPSTGEILEFLLEKRFITLEGSATISRIQPWMEIVLGLWALSGVMAAWAARLLFVLYLAFAGLILYASGGYLSLPLDCGCFGSGEGTPVYLLLLRNMALAVLLLCFRVQHRRIAFGGILKLLRRSTVRRFSKP